MSSNPGDVARQPDLLNADDPNAAGDQLSDVGSFSRTRPDVVDDDDDLDTSPPPEDFDGDEAAQLTFEGSASQSNAIASGRAIIQDGEVSIQVGDFTRCSNQSNGCRRNHWRLLRYRHRSSLLYVPNEEVLCFRLIAGSLACY
jgi:hypothetical protein